MCTGQCCPQINTVWDPPEKLNDIEKARNFKDVQFEKCVPICLIDNWNKANSTAYKLQKEKSMITRIIIKNGEVQILAKSKIEDSFEKIDYDKKKTKEKMISLIKDHF